MIWFLFFCVYDEPSADLCLHKDLHLANVHHRAVKRDSVQSIPVGVSLLDCANGRGRGCNNLICFVALTTPMSLLGRKLCQQWLPQFLSLISVVQNVSRRGDCSLSLWFFKTKQNGMIYEKQNPQPSSGCGFC